jgi:hypothetical protein
MLNEFMQIRAPDVDCSAMGASSRRQALMHSRGCLVGAFCLVLVSIVPPAWAGSGYDQYRRLQAQSKLYKNLGRPSRAAKALVDAYEQYPNELVLLEAVQLYREADEFETALRLAERYMRIGRAPAGRLSGRQQISQLRTILSAHNAELEIITKPNNAWICLQRPGVPDQDCLPGPILRWLKEGALVIHATTKAGVHRKYQHNVHAGKHVRITIPIELPVPRGRLDVFAPQHGQTVSVDGVIRGKTPLTGLEVTAGHHVVSVTLSGPSTWRSDINVNPGHTTTVYAGTAPPESPASPTVPAKTAKRLPNLPPVIVVARRPVMPKRGTAVLVAVAAEQDDTTKPATTPKEQAEQTTTAPPPEPVDDSKPPETAEEEDNSADDELEVVAVPLPSTPEDVPADIPEEDIADPAPIPEEPETSDSILTEDSTEEPEEMDQEDVLSAAEDTSEGDVFSALEDDSETSDPGPIADMEDDVINEDDGLGMGDEDSDDSVVASVSSTGGTPWQSITGWTSLGIGAAAIGGAIYTAILTMATVDEANALDVHSPNYASQFKQHKTDAELYGLLTTIIMPAGGALVAAGITLLLLSPDGATEPSISLDDTHRLRFNAVPHRHGIMVHTSIDF